jgi:hypothetical protein
MIILTNFITDFFSGMDVERSADFFTRLFFNSVSVFILIRFIFYPNNGQSENLFVYFIVGLIVFVIASILGLVKLEFGFALGLFAIFSIIRFRTTNVELKELTYLFAVIGLSVINAFVDFKVVDWQGIVLTNSIILIFAFIMEKYKPRKAVLKKSLTFTVSGLQVLNSNKLLKEEIKNKTNIDVFKVEIIKISESKNEVTVWIYFKLTDNLK